ncbi:MAG: helix-turn-helix domain-containing protein [Chloroflexi bacterium]|nr:helix-turn-helix domain-containing protein [Chloroflexota bacterium]
MITNRAARYLRSARAKAGLTQRELAKKSGIPQPTIAAIEAGRQDPRHKTLERLLRACGFEWDVHRIPGSGIDRTLIADQLRLSPTERVHRLAVGYRSLAPLRGILRPR